MTRRQILVSSLIVAATAVALAPGARLLLLYANLWPKPYSLEIGEYRNVVTRYVYDGNSSVSNILEGREAGRRRLGKVADREFSLDDYYTSMMREYRIDESASSGEGAAGNLKLEDRREFSQVGAAPAAGRSRVVLGARDRDVVGSLSGMKVIHGHDGTVEDRDQPSEESFDPRMTREREEEKDAPVESPYAESGHRRDSAELRVYPENRFIGSPAPSSGKVNVVDDLRSLRLVMGKSHYFRFEVIRVNLVSPRPVNLDDFKILLVRDGAVYPNVGGDNDAFFKAKAGVLYANLSLGYNPPAGVYQVLVRSKANPQWAGVSEKFSLVYRKVPPLQKGFSVVNWEYTVPIRRTDIIAPSGRTGDWKTIAEWLRYMDADAFWMLAAQTTGWDNSITKENPWVRGGLENLALMAPHLKSNGIQVGAYIMCYYTPENGKNLAGYDPSLIYSASTGTLSDTRFISLSSEQRFQDMLRLAKAWQANPSVDYIGLDFIRTGEGDGCENGPEVVDEMNIPTPAGYASWSRMEQVKWFGRHLRLDDNAQTILKWRWWRAHKVATILNRLLVEGRITKPAWVFTLGWEHGKQHGQDPYMFFDAGAFIDAAMLYEASEAQFRNLMDQWPAYMRDNRNNVIIGNSADTRLLDGRSENPALEYTYRNSVGWRGIYREGHAKGIFLHDFSRALWSTKRGLSTLEWALVAGASQSSFRHEAGVLPYRATLAFNADRRTGTIKVVNDSARRIDRLTMGFVPTAAWAKVSDNVPKVFALAPKETVSFTFNAVVKADFEDREPPLGYVIDHKDFRRCFFFGVRSKRDLTKWLSVLDSGPGDLAGR